MKNIIKTAICLIVISSILLYSSVSHAANAAQFSVSAGSTKTGFLTDSIYGNTENPYNYFTFTFYIEPRIILSTPDVYVNGSLVVGMNLQFDYSTDFSLVGQEARLNYNSTANNFYVFYNQHYGSLTNPRLTVYFDNYWAYSGIDIGSFEYSITIKSNYDINPPSSVLCTPSISIVSNNTSVSALPITGQESALIIKQCITDALHNSELDLVYDYLNLWKTTQDGYLADIVLSTDDVELWLSYINSAQATLQNKVDLIYALELTFPGYFNSMISLLQQIRDMNASDTAAESQMQNAEQQLSQAVNDMEVQKPNINNVVNAGDQYMDSNITGAQGDTFFWLHGTNIFVTILTMAVTIGILGFVIYGKSG